MESASLLSRESTTLSFANPQKGHFMALGTVTKLIVAGTATHQAVGGEGESSARASSCSLSSESFRKESRSRCASSKPTGTTETNVTTHNRIPQLADSSCEASKICWRAEIVANCEPPPTPGNCIKDPSMPEPIKSRTLDTVMCWSGAP